MNSLLLTLMLPLAAAMEPPPQVLLWEDRARQQMQAAFTSLGNGDLVNAGETIKKIEREIATVSSLSAMESAYSPLQWTPKLNAGTGEAW